MRTIFAALFLCLMLIPAKAHQWGKTSDQYAAGMLGSSPQYHGEPRCKRQCSRPSVPWNGVVGPLAAKISEIISACGSRAISTLRHTRVAGSGRPSLHNYGEAVDVSGNPACIYAHLSGWPGGYSIDYGRMRHVHISYEPNGREWGARFAHYHGHKHRRFAGSAS